MPVVDIGRRHTGDGVDVVRVADEHGAGLAVDHLASLGHRSIGHIDGGDLPAAAPRRRGYRQAMKRHGLGDEIRILQGDYTEESGATAARHILSQERLPTGIFAANDRCAHGVLDTLARARIATLMAERAVQAITERLDHGRIEARDIVLDPAW